MKYLSSLTTFFAVFLLVVYLGVFTGIRINSLVAGKKLVSASETPVPSASASISPSSLPSSSPKVIAKATAVNNTPKVAQITPSRTSVPTVSNPTQPPAVVNNPTPESTSVPSVDAPTPAPTPAPTQDNRCIIIISGGQYDVTAFRSIHSGGDIFKCGTDMTAAFLSQHPASYLDKMAQYKI